MKNTSLTKFVGPKYWPTWFGLLMLRMLTLLPLPILAVLGYSIGLVFYFFGKSRRDIAYKNISVCLPELSAKRRRQINRHHFCLIGQSVFTTAMNWWISDRRFTRLVELGGREHYDAALQAGRNVIILAPHFMSMDVGGYILARERSIITMYQYSKNKLVNEIVNRGRTRYGGLLVERKEPLTKLIRLIRKGHPFYYLPDQDAGRKGVFAPFFHEQAATFAMLGKFSEMTDAVVIPCSIRIKPWGQGYKVTLGKPLSNFPCGDELADTVRMNEVIAAMIKVMPEQYFWVHKRFKTRPPESDTKFYN